MRNLIPRMISTGVLAIMTASNAPEAQEPESGFYPVAATEETLADSEALARLERPGEIFFQDGFETDASLDNYFEITHLDDGGTRFADDPRHVHSGRRSIQFTAPAREGGESGAGAHLWFGPEGYDQVYFRWYIRFAEDYDQGNLNHTGGGLAGVAGTNRWGGMGKAGIRPQGDDRFSCRLEPWKDWGRYPPPGYLFIYAYWMDMKPSRDGHYWGNFMEAPEEKRLVIERGRWYCMEMMVKVNHIGRTDGELAAWIDGQLYLHYRNFRWRSAEDVRIKRAGFGIYIHEARKDNTVWYDDVVLSTGYIGPLPDPPSRVEESSWGSVKKAQ